MEPFSELGNKAGTVTAPHPCSPPAPSWLLTGLLVPPASLHPDFTLTDSSPFHYPVQCWAAGNLVNGNWVFASLPSPDLKPWVSNFTYPGARDFSQLALDPSRNQLIVGAR